MSIETRINRFVKKTGVKKSRWTVPLSKILSSVLYSTRSWQYPMAKWLPKRYFIEDSDKQISINYNIALCWT